MELPAIGHRESCSALPTVILIYVTCKLTHYGQNCSLQ